MHFNLQINERLIKKLVSNFLLDVKLLKINFVNYFLSNFFLILKLRKSYDFYIIIIKFIIFVINKNT